MNGPASRRPRPGRVLVTGSAGRIGRVLCPGLTDLGWTVRGFDREPTHVLAEGTVGEIGDLSALDDATDGVDAVVHLAAIPFEAPFRQILEANIDGTYRVFDAARRAGVRRVVYASSSHAVGYTPRMPLAPADLPPRADTYYGLSKVFGEALARLYVDRYRMEFACLRIGACAPRPSTLRELEIWLSPADAVRLVHACLTVADLGFATVWGVSANTRNWWDLAAGRALGYHPLDDAEVHASQILTESAGSGELDPDSPELTMLGGEFAGPSFDADRIAPWTGVP